MHRLFVELQKDLVILMSFMERLPMKATSSRRDESTERHHPSPLATLLNLYRDRQVNIVHSRAKDVPVVENVLAVVETRDCSDSDFNIATLQGFGTGCRYKKQFHFSLR